MRDLRYKAFWYKETYDVSDIQWFPSGKVRRFKVFNSEGKWLYPNENIVLRQSTGLKDKNGVDIYEGDILGKRPYGYFRADGKTKDNRHKGKEWQCFAVEWGEYDASEAGLVSGYEYETDGKYAGWNIVVGGYDSDLKDNEVIGNIYETPNLIERSE